MVNLNFKRLFNLRLAHDYFIGGRPSGMNLRPTKATQRLISGGRMLFKPVPNGITVLYEALDDEKTPVVQHKGKMKFVFALIVDNPKRFFNVTDLDMKETDRKFRSADILYFKNSTGSANPETISHILLDSLRSKSFSYLFGFPGTPGSVIFSLTDAGGQKISAGKYAEGNPLPVEITLAPDEEGIYRQNIDIRNFPDALYRIMVREEGSAEWMTKEVFYAENELSSQIPAGIVEIVLGPGHLYDDTHDYQLKFTSKKTIWKYYIINRNGKFEDTGNLDIEDKSGDFSEFYESVGFIRDIAEPPEAAGIKGEETVIFRSEEPIPFYEEPKTSICLKKKSESACLIKHLPNPSHNGVIKDSGEGGESEIYVFI